MERTDYKPVVLRALSIRGTAMIELSLFAPVLFGVILFLIEIGSLFDTSQDVSLLSREAANLVYRSCVQETAGNSLGSCITTTVGPEILALGQRTVRNFNEGNGAVLVTAYRWNVVSGNWQGTLVATLRDSSLTAAAPTSKQPASYSTSELAQLPQKGIFIVTETIVGYEPVALPHSLGLALPSEVNRVAIM